MKSNMNKMKKKKRYQAKLLDEQITFGELVHSVQVKNTAKIFKSMKKYSRKGKTKFKRDSQ